MKKGILAGISLIVGFAGVAVAVGMGIRSLGGTANKKIDLYSNCYNIVSQWVSLKQDGISLEKYFKEKGYHTIAIYGMGRLGGMLYDELKSSDIDVKYCIDRDSYCAFEREVKMIQPEDEMEKVDVIVVTPFTLFDEIDELLSKKINTPLVSIEEVVYDI